MTKLISYATILLIHLVRGSRLRDMRALSFASQPLPQSAAKPKHHFALDSRPERSVDVCSIERPDGRRAPQPTVRRSQLEPAVDRSMGGCTSSTAVVASAWTPNEGMVSELCAYLTDRQMQLVRDTWDVLLNTDAESSAWTNSFVRHCDSNKELNRLFNYVESMHNFQRVETSGDEEIDDEQRWRPDSAVGIGVLPIDSDVQAKTPDAAAAAADTAATTVVIGDAGGGVSNSATVLRRHAQFVMETLGAAVECLELDDSSVFANILVALGQIHGTYDVKQHYLPLFWTTVRRSIRDVLGDEVFTVEVDRAWQAVFAYVVGRMRDGIRMHRQLQYVDEMCCVGNGSYSPESASSVPVTCNATVAASPTQDDWAVRWSDDER